MGRSSIFASSSAGATPESTGLLLGPSGSGKTLLIRQMQHKCLQRRRLVKRSSSLKARGITLPKALQRKVRKEEPVIQNELESYETVPTTGADLDCLTYRKHSMTIREVGAPMLPLWKSYYKTSSYLLYVVDMTNTTQISTAAIEFLNIISSSEMSSKPIVLILNKIDLPNTALSVDRVADLFDFPSLQESVDDIHVFTVSAATGKNVELLLQWMADNKL